MTAVLHRPKRSRLKGSPKPPRTTWRRKSRASSGTAKPSPPSLAAAHEHGIPQEAVAAALEAYAHQIVNRVAMAQDDAALEETARLHMRTDIEKYYREKWDQKLAAILNRKGTE